MQVGLFHAQLQNFLEEKGLHLQELIYGQGAPAILEKKWLETFSEKEFAELNILPYFPRMVRGLPRLYHRDDPSQCRLKTHFTDFPSLKRLGAERAFLSLFEQISVAKGSKISLFTYVMGDGWGDLIAAWEVIQIFKERFKELEIRWIAILPEKRVPPELNADCICYWKEGDVDAEALGALRTSDCILQLPTYYPKTDEIKESLKKIPLSLPLPTWIEVGEYGFLESDWFHPQTARYCLGLHCLEKGILIHKTKKASFAEVKNKTLLLQLFNTVSPGPSEVEKYEAQHVFYLSYLSSAAGGLVYLQALIKAHERDEKRIDICIPDIHWLIQLIEKGTLKEIEGLKELEIFYAKQRYQASIKNEGKSVRVICPGIVSDEDFRKLLRLSKEFVGVRGNQSLSEAISANKVFFYDSQSHSQHFLCDLAALAENRIGPHRNALAIFRAMRKTLLHNIPVEEGTWVEESHFQEREPLIQIGIQVGLALQDPDAIAGFKKLSRIISEEYNAEKFLCHLVQKELYHRIWPDQKRGYDETMASFLNGEMGFTKSYLELASHLRLEKNNALWKMRHVKPKENHELHQRLGQALRDLIHSIAKEEIWEKSGEIAELTASIGGSLAHEAEELQRHLKSFKEISKKISESALHLEQTTREL